MKRSQFLVLMAAVMLAASGAVSAQMLAPPISGTVISAQRGPLGGVTVSLVHPVIGRSSPVFSAPNGTYFFVNIPPQQQPFFIEAYWGNQLLFRGQLVYQGAPIIFNIPLP
jgi:hypothetical protein